MKTKKPKKPIKFETVEQHLNFRCEWGVYREGLDSSMCYVTSPERGEFIAKALEAFVTSGGAAKWIRNLKRRSKKKPLPKNKSPKE